MSLLFIFFCLTAVLDCPGKDPPLVVRSFPSMDCPKAMNGFIEVVNSDPQLRPKDGYYLLRCKELDPHA